MPRVGNGTGMDGSAPSEDGLRSNANERPEKPGRPYFSPTNGEGATLDGGNRMSPLGSGRNQSND